MERGAKREAILDAARDALLDPGGAAGLTLEKVLKQAGAGTGTFYHHFPGGRVQLVAEVYTRTQDQYEARLLRVLQRNRDAQAGVKALVHEHVRLFQEEPGLMRLLLENRGAAEPRRRSLQLALQAWAAGAALPPQPPAELVALWLGPVLEFGRIATGAAPADRLAQAAWAAVSAG